MTIQSLRQKLNRLEIFEQRRQEDDYQEFVVFNWQSSDLAEVLSSELGPAVKPAGMKPSRDFQNLTKKFGGIFDNQTLFKKESGSAVILAMLWPWSDNEHTTLKIASVRSN